MKKKLEQIEGGKESESIIKSKIIYSDLSEKRRKITIYDFIPLKVIGRGAFGEVRVCKKKETNEIYAIKKLSKVEMKLKNQVFNITSEKEVLCQANCDWIVELKYSFQDNINLYLVMEYLPGGDFMNLLIKKEIIPEPEAKFYLAEIVLAVEAVHNLNCIHRDIKPDNILIDREGHIKLSDFGLCKLLNVKLNSK